MTGTQGSRRYSTAERFKTWKRDKWAEGYREGWKIGHRKGFDVGVKNHMMLLNYCALRKFGERTADDLAILLEDTSSELRKENLIELAESIIECETPAQLLERVRRWVEPGA
ncbi:MAG: hypothetical protein OXE86_00495 [Alphaproteobacteria bacterium]|nr:hypothetical protein [Alphaproteobacteria bacterium]